LKILTTYNVRIGYKNAKSPSTITQALSTKVKTTSLWILHIGYAYRPCFSLSESLGRQGSFRITTRK